MDRTNLTDGTGRWFDRDRAIGIDEARYHDGHNYIGHASGGQWDYETLYYTASGVWIFCRSSQRDCSRSSYIVVDIEDAIRWLGLAEMHDASLLAGLPEDVQKQIRAGFASAEV